MEDQDIAWHCGAKTYRHPVGCNANSSGIEMYVRNKGSQADTSRDWYFEDATVRAAIDLTRELMTKYNISANHVIRHNDVTGKICPNPYVYNTTAHTWDQFKVAIAVPAEPGWIHDDHGWWYRDPDGGYPKMFWRLINHHWYCFGASGYMQTGWVQRNSDTQRTGSGDWYYLEESGEFQGAC